MSRWPCGFWRSEGSRRSGSNWSGPAARIQNARFVEEGQGWGVRARGARADAPRRTSVHEAVELASVLAGDLAYDVRRQMAELLLDVLRRLRPHAVRVRI